MLKISYIKFAYRLGYPKLDRITKEIFGEGLPSAYELDHNKTLLIYSSDGILSYPKQLPPNIVQVGPLHIVSPNPLPEVCFYKYNTNYN